MAISPDQHGYQSHFTQMQSGFAISLCHITNVTISYLPRCSGSLESRVSRAESVYEMGDDYSDHDQVEDDHLQGYWQDPQHQRHPWLQARLGEEGPSLASELKHLDRAASRPCLVQVGSP